MTGQELGDALVQRGLDEGERAAIADVFDRVLSASPRDGAWSHAWWTPGRLEVFGTHTDYAGCRTLVCAVPRGIAMVGRPRRDDRVIVTDVATGESVDLSVLQPAAFDGWRRYVAVVVARLARNFDGALRGSEIAFQSTLPRASGMSSSSALVVATASALADLNDLSTHPRWIANIQSRVDVAGYFACIENGRSFGDLAGDAGVGTHGGSEDHAAILTGRPSTVTAFRFAPMARLADVAVSEEWRFVIAPSNVRAEKTGGAQASYNRLAREVQTLLDLWNAHEPPVGSLADALETAPTASVRLQDLVERSTLPAASIESLTRRLAHVVREDAMVQPALESFRTGNTEALGNLSAESQAIAESLLRNQVPETVQLAHAARRLGAFAARSFGAGFGGSVWALVDADAAPAFAARWHADAFVMRPGPPHALLSQQFRR